MRRLLASVSFAALAFAGIGLGGGMSAYADAGCAATRTADVTYEFPAPEGDGGEDHRQVADLDIEYDYPRPEGDSGQGMRPFPPA